MLEKIRNKLRAGLYHISQHALKRMDERGVGIQDVKKVIFEGEMIEAYPNDKPYPSGLILGYVRNKPLYVLCAGNEWVYIITVHWLDPEKWLDPKTRREKKYEG